MSSKTSDIMPHIWWAFSLLITYSHINLHQGFVWVCLCGYSLYHPQGCYSGACMFCCRTDLETPCNTCFLLYTLSFMLTWRHPPYNTCFLPFAFSLMLTWRHPLYNTCFLPFDVSLMLTWRYLLYNTCFLSFAFSLMLTWRFALYNTSFLPFVLSLKLT